MRVGRKCRRSRGCFLSAWTSATKGMEGRLGTQTAVTHRNSALSSLNPSASANTASLELPPKSRRANIARYRSNSGKRVLSISARMAGMEAESGADEELELELDAGAGSMVGKLGLRGQWGSCSLFVVRPATESHFAAAEIYRRISSCTNGDPSGCHDPTHTDSDSSN